MLLKQKKKKNMHSLMVARIGAPAKVSIVYILVPERETRYHLLVIQIASELYFFARDNRVQKQAFLLVYDLFLSEDGFCPGILPAPPPPLSPLYKRVTPHNILHIWSYNLYTNSWEGRYIGNSFSIQFHKYFILECVQL